MHVVIWDKCNQRLCKANTNLQCVEVTHYLQIYSVIQLIEAAVNVWSILNNMTPLCILTSKLKYTHLRVWIGFFSSVGLDKRQHVSSVSVVRAELKSSSWMLNICLCGKWPPVTSVLFLFCFKLNNRVLNCIMWSRLHPHGVTVACGV